MVVHKRIKAGCSVTIVAKDRIFPSFKKMVTFILRRQLVTIIFLHKVTVQGE